MTKTYIKPKKVSQLKIDEVEKLVDRLNIIEHDAQENGMWSPVISHALDEYEYSNWKYSSDSTDQLFDLMRDILNTFESGNLLWKSIKIANHDRKKKPSKSTKRKSVKKCKCK
jgi:hypothetical protein